MRKALFLDRDGIVNIDHGYVSRVEDFEFSDGIFKLIHLFQKKDYLIFIVTNQSGIARGYYSEEDFKTLTLWMIKSFKLHDIRINDVYHCPHAPKDNCNCRKPATGMIEDNFKKYNIDLKNSWMIGDKQSDIDFATNAKIEQSISIGSRDIINSSHHFNTISKCASFLEKNQHIIK